MSKSKLLHLYNKWIEIDELNNSHYGDEFFDRLLLYTGNGLISEAEVNCIIECLTDIDEIRELIAEEIKLLIFKYIEERKFSIRICDLLKVMCNLYTVEGSKKLQRVYRETINSLLHDEIDIENAIEIYENNEKLTRE